MSYSKEKNIQQVKLALLHSEQNQTKTNHGLLLHPSVGHPYFSIFPLHLPHDQLITEPNLPAGCKTQSQKDRFQGTGKYRGNAREKALLLLLKSQEKNWSPWAHRQHFPTVWSFMPSFKPADRKGCYHGNGPSQEAQWSKHRLSQGLFCPQSRPVGKYYTRRIPETQSKQFVIWELHWPGSKRSVILGKCKAWIPYYQGHWPIGWRAIMRYRGGPHYTWALIVCSLVGTGT